MSIDYKYKRKNDSLSSDATEAWLPWNQVKTLIVQAPPDVCLDHITLLAQLPSDYKCRVDTETIDDLDYFRVTLKEHSPGRRSLPVRSVEGLITPDEAGSSCITLITVPESALREVFFIIFFPLLCLIYVGITAGPNNSRQIPSIVMAFLLIYLIGIPITLFQQYQAHQKAFVLIRDHFLNLEDDLKSRSFAQQRYAQDQM